MNAWIRKAGLGLAALGLVFAGESFLPARARRWALGSIVLALALNQTRAVMEEPWPLAPKAFDAAKPGSYPLAEATLDSPPRSWVR